jgi:hypothetical protein
VGGTGAAGTEGQRLASLATDAAGTTAINGGSVRTSGAQSYGDAVTLGADTPLPYINREASSIRISCYSYSACDTTVVTLIVGENRADILHNKRISCSESVVQ